MYDLCSEIEEGRCLPSYFSSFNFLVHNLITLDFFILDSILLITKSTGKDAVIKMVRPTPNWYK